MPTALHRFLRPPRCGPQRLAWVGGRARRFVV